MEKPDDIRIEFRSDPRLLRPVRQLVRGYMESCGLTPDRCDEIVLAVDEACANAMRHAYCGRCDGTLDLVLRRSGEAI